MPDRAAQIDVRIQSLVGEIERLHRGRKASDNQLQEMLLKITEVQLNLATQDKALEKLGCAIHGAADGKSGLLMRVDRIERTATNMIRFAWLALAALVTAAADLALKIAK